ncbi:MAG: FliM/FliN family flagellar motor switch protein [Pseudomonadota bacterium]
MDEVLAKLAKNIEKHARAYLGSVVEAMILDHEIRTFSDVLDGISMPAMIGIIEIDRRERAALINLDLDLVYHVVDLRMGGLPTELPEFVARRPTSIDWSMCQPLVDIALDGFSQALSESFGRSDIVEFHCTTFEHLPMLANIVPDRSDVLCVQVSLDIGEAARSGNFELVIPLAALDAMKASIGKSTKVSDDGKDAWADHMFDVVMQTEIELTPVLQTTQFSVAQLSKLEIGQVLPLEPEAHKNVTLNVSMGDDTHMLATGRLGALKGMKALKLTSDPDQQFINPLAQVAKRSGRA